MLVTGSFTFGYCLRFTYLPVFPCAAVFGTRHSSSSSFGKLPAYICLPSCHLLESLEPRSAIHSVQPELRLLPSELLLLHLQCKPLLQLRHTWENPLELPNPSLSSLLSATSGTTQSLLLTPPGPIPLTQLSCMLYIFKFSRLLAKYLY